MKKNLEMDDTFSQLASLIGEKARAKMLWHLLDGRAYTAFELALIADISKQSCSNHLKKLLDKNILKVEKQGRHRYFRLYDDQVAKALEGIAFLMPQEPAKHASDSQEKIIGVKYARTCYDHLAGYLGVSIREHLQNHAYISLHNEAYECTPKGLEKFKSLGIEIEKLKSLKRKFAYPCLDWSERKPHIGGALGAALLCFMLDNAWVRKNKNSRELFLSAKGQLELEKSFKLKIICPGNGD
ncbi:MAG: helix-turn-helix transcriptional regulator [Bacteroidota bacterium]